MGGKSEDCGNKFCKLVPHLCCRPTGDETGAGEDAHTTAGLETGATGCFFVASASRELRVSGDIAGQRLNYSSHPHRGAGGRADDTLMNDLVYRSFALVE